MSPIRPIVVVTNKGGVEVARVSAAPPAPKLLQGHVEVAALLQEALVYLGDRAIPSILNRTTEDAFGDVIHERVLRKVAPGHPEYPTALARALGIHARLGDWHFLTKRERA